MSRSSLISLPLALATVLFAGSFARAAEDKTLTKVAQAPSGVSAPISATINPQGYRVQSGEGTVCEVWLLKELAVKPRFKPTLNVKYPLQSGQLVGVLRVGDKGEYTDFRGQPVKPGVYTLRYGQQPQDGNHIGTSELADFLVAIPAAADADPKPIVSLEELHKDSAKSVGGNHPAIFSLLPPEAAAGAATLAKDDNDRWVLGVPAQATKDGKKVSLSFRMVVIGKVAG
jgi:hypothetical protein